MHWYLVMCETSQHMDFVLQGGQCHWKQSNWVAGVFHLPFKMKFNYGSFSFQDDTLHNDRTNSWCNVI